MTQLTDRAADRALDEALDRITALSGTILTVRRLHAARRGLVGVRCADCGHRYPCPTVQLAGGPPR